MSTTWQNLTGLGQHRPMCLSQPAKIWPNPPRVGPVRGRWSPGQRRSNPPRARRDRPGSVANSARTSNPGEPQRVREPDRNSGAIGSRLAGGVLVHPCPWARHRLRSADEVPWPCGHRLRARTRAAGSAPRHLRPAVGVRTGQIANTSSPCLCVVLRRPGPLHQPLRRPLRRGALWGRWRRRDLHELRRCRARRVRSGDRERRGVAHGVRGLVHL